MKSQITAKAFFCLLLLLSACAPGVRNTPAIPTGILASPQPSPTVSPTPRVSPSVPPQPAFSPTPSVTSTSALQVCSPLQGEPLDGLSKLVANPYHPPVPGSDDPHHGVDLAVRLPDTQVAVAGRPVQAALPGRVVMVTRDRFPYGNAVLIETPLDALPASGWPGQVLPTPAPTNEPRSALTCPAAAPPTFPDPSRRSLYLLYAHMQQPSPLAPGDTVSCGQVIGAVGSSGNALNPHLHLETRFGPSGLSLTSMAHYDASATTEEMSSYCLWRISGLFQMIDPLKLLDGN